MTPAPAVLGERIGIGRTAEVYAWGDEHIIKIRQVSANPPLPQGTH